MITEDELELIQWRATRGSHYAGTYIQGSKHAQHVVEEDVPRLLMEINLLQKRLDENGAGDGSDARLRKAAQDLLDYRKRVGPLNFQLEKADDFLREIRLALEEEVSDPPLQDQ
jgi:hypothetical protein